MTATVQHLDILKSAIDILQAASSGFDTHAHHRMSRAPSEHCVMDCISSAGPSVSGTRWPIPAVCGSTSQRLSLLPMTRTERSFTS